MNIKKRKEQWPFIWGTDVEPRFSIEENTRYLFPEYETPSAAPDLQKLVDEGTDYSIAPAHLGMCNVVMLGRQFIDELYERDIHLEDIGEWSKV